MTGDVRHPDAYRKLADAIRAGDPAGAKKAAQDLLELANTSMTAALDRRGKRR
jgi:DNA-binding FadR family transcriptional regulator